MALLFRIVLAFVFIGIFLGIIVLSFFSSPQYLSLPDFLQTQEKINDSFSGGIISENILSWFETLFQTWKDVEANFQDKKLEINISSWEEYLSSFRDLRKEYIFKGDGYRIRQEGIGEVYIDTSTKPWKVLVLSLNTYLHISLTSKQWNETYTDIFLAPHMYLEFQPSRGKLLKNADVVRIQTVYKMWYIGDNIFHAYKNSFFTAYNIWDTSFFFQILEYIKDKDGENKKILLDIQKQKVWKIPWYETLQRYSQLFVNKEKKKVFYKNIILEQFLDFTFLQKYDAEKIRKISRDIKKLKSLDIEAYNEILGVQERIYQIVSSSYLKEFIVPKMLFTMLDSWKEYSEKYYFSLYAYSLFSLYDFQGVFSYDTSYKFLQAFEKSIWRWNEKKKEKKLRYQYFTYFLQKQLSYLLQRENPSSNITSIIDTLTSYIKISSYSYDGDPTDRITSLYVYNEILKQIDTFLRTEYFLQERNDLNLLETHTKNKITTQDLSKFKKQIYTIFDIYEKNKSLLSVTNSRDQSIKKGITLRKKRIIEYLDALENYQTYTSKYDISKKDLLNLDVYSTEENEVLTKDKILKYLSRFVWLNLENIKIDIIENKDQEPYYHIENIFILGSEFSFDVYPRSSYRLENLIVDTKPLSFVYKLSIIESEWEKKYETASKDEKNKFDFTRFFLITFSSQGSTEVEEYIVKKPQYNEDKTEVVFKRNKLLWSKGEFNILRNILPLEYNNIRVEKKGRLYNIFIENAEIRVSIMESGNQKEINGIFSWEYVLNTVDHYFTKVSLELYRDKEKDINRRMFWGNSIYIAGKIHLVSFEEEMKKMLSFIASYESIYSIIHSQFSNSSINMQYTLRNNNMSFKFDSQEKKYTIIFANGKVERIYKGTEKLLWEPINISDIVQYLQ